MTHVAIAYTQHDGLLTPPQHRAAAAAKWTTMVVGRYPYGLRTRTSADMSKRREVELYSGRISGAHGYSDDNGGRVHCGAGPVSRYVFSVPSTLL
mgnify:CR=1 FL=1